MIARLIISWTCRSCWNAAPNTGSRYVVQVVTRVTARSARATVQKPSTGKGRPAPVQTAITKVLSKRRTGMTMERLQAALPDFDQKSLLNATFVMRRKGSVTFDRSGKGPGKYVWAENASTK